MSSRYLAVAAIIARAELFTVEGVCPSLQLMVASAESLLPAVLDQLKSVNLPSQTRQTFQKQQHDMLRALPQPWRNGQGDIFSPDAGCRLAKACHKLCRHDKAKRLLNVICYASAADNSPCFVILLQAED